MRPHYHSVDVAIDNNPETNGDIARIYIRVEPAPVGYSRLLVWTGNDTVTEVDVPYSERAPRPSLVIPRQILDAMLAEVRPGLGTAEALTRHLNDAVTVRDRLLSMVEHVVRGAR